jgi:hypothetical protein
MTGSFFVNAFFAKYVTISPSMYSDDLGVVVEPEGTKG